MRVEQLAALPEYGAFADYSSTSTVVGWSSYTAKQIRYKRVGTIVFVSFHIVGTSNAATATFTIPHLAASGMSTQGALVYTAVDNGVVLTVPPRAYVNTGSGTININKDMAGGAWTASGSKQVDGCIWYEAT